MHTNDLEKWLIKDQQLFQRFEFKDFKEAMLFGNEVAELAELSDHHPTMVIGWGFVEVYLYTFSQQKITELDWMLAKKIQAIL
jgi:4a-hydroxytetrahydrobiopterin dehydratase